MLSCDDAAGLIARRADGALDAADLSLLDAHAAGCAACRAALEDQRRIAAILRSRPPERLSPRFNATLAAKLDDASGWFGIADWRIWTFRIAPVAGALGLAAFLTAGASAGTSSPTVEEWTFSTPDTSSSASALWQDDVTTDSLLEAILTGSGGSGGGSVDVR